MAEAQHPLAKGFLTHALSIASGTAAGQAVLIAVTPLITRMYSSTSFGTFGVFTSFIAVASIFVTLRLDMAIPSARSDADANRLLMLTLIIVGPASLACAPMVLFTELGAATAGVPELFVLFALAAVGTAAPAAFSALRYWHVRQMNFARIGRGVAAQGAARAAGPLLMALLSRSWFCLALGDVIGRLFGIFSLGRDAQRIIRAQNAAESTHESAWQFLQRYRRFPTLLMPSSVLDAIAANLPVPIIASLFGFAAAGEYALVVRIAAAPAALIGASIGDVFHARLADCLRTSPRQAQAQLQHAALRLLTLGAVIYVPACILAPLLFGFVFGEQWRHAGMLFTVMTPFLLMGFIVSPLSRALLATDRMELKLAIDALFLIVPFVCLVFTRQYGFTIAVAIFSGAQVLVYVCYAALIARAVASHKEPGVVG